MIWMLYIHSTLFSIFLFQYHIICLFYSTYTPRNALSFLAEAQQLIEMYICDDHNEQSNILEFKTAISWFTKQWQQISSCSAFRISLYVYMCISKRSYNEKVNQRRCYWIIPYIFFHLFHLTVTSSYYY